MAVVCAACAEKSNDEILGVVRREFAPTFDKASIVNAAASGVHFEAVTRRIVHGIGMAFPLDEPDIPDVALLFGELLEQQKLTRFDAYFRGASNCFEIVNQLYLDFKTLGLENAFTYKMGFSSRMKSDGEPIGLHGWIEADGWAIDCSGGAHGNPILFQRVADYYAAREMKDVQDREIGEDIAA